MRLTLVRHLWGYPGPWPAVFAAVRAAGYAGIETVTPPPPQQPVLGELLAEHGLFWICCVQTNGTTAEDHLADLARSAEVARRLGARFVSAHAGRDSFSAKQSAALFAGTLRLEDQLGIAIAHETHRGRPLYNPWAALAAVEQFPDLKLTCDFSHWVCVAERLLGDCEPLLRRVAEQAYYVHARVGYSQGPQVPDPRSPTYAHELAAHEQWWDWIWDAQQRRGFQESLLCPEFGPPPYLQTDPADGKPLADLAAVVDWQAARQRDRFARRSHGT